MKAFEEYKDAADQFILGLEKPGGMISIGGMGDFRGDVGKYFIDGKPENAWFDLRTDGLVWVHLVPDCFNIKLPYEEYVGAIALETGEATSYWQEESSLVALLMRQRISERKAHSRLDGADMRIARGTSYDQASQELKGYPTTAEVEGAFGAVTDYMHAVRMVDQARSGYDQLVMSQEPQGVEA